MKIKNKTPIRKAAINKASPIVLNILGLMQDWINRDNRNKESIMKYGVPFELIKRQEANREG